MGREGEERQGKAPTTCQRPSSQQAPFSPGSGDLWLRECALELEGLGSKDSSAV